MVEYLFLASNFNKYAGPNNHLLDLCNHLYEKLHFDLRLITHNSNFDSLFSKWIKFPILPVLVGSSLTPWTRLASALFNIRIIKKTIQSLGISRDKIFVNANIDTLFEAYWAAKMKVATGYNALFNNRNSFIFNLMDRLAAKHAIGKIVAHTEYQKNLYMRIGIEEKRIEIIPHCIDVSRIKKLANDSTEETMVKPVIFYGGRLTVEKGIKELLNSYQQISEQMESTLVLVGTGPLKEWILKKKRTVEKNSKGSRVVCLGWQPMNVFLSKMREADVVVLPSHNESFGIILLEAMSLKRPIVATRSGGVTDIITDHADGILVNPHDHNELAKAILELLGDSKMRARVGSNALTTVQRKYEVIKVSSQFTAFMEK